MEFQRARSKEQKSIRRDQIIEATLKLYEKEPLEKISLASIANELNFSRANLYKYVTSKEEIFLWIIDSDLEKWVEQVCQRFEKYEQMDLKTFCNLWAEQLHQNRRLIQLFPILTVVVETNIKETALAAFKENLINSFQRLNLIVSKFFPDLSMEQLKRFSKYQLQYALSLHHRIVFTENQQQAFKKAGLFYDRIDFVTEFAEYLEIIITGIRTSGI